MVDWRRRSIVFTTRFGDIQGSLEANNTWVNSLVGCLKSVHSSLEVGHQSSSGLASRLKAAQGAMRTSEASSSLKASHAANKNLEVVRATMEADSSASLPLKYREFEDVFEKRNVDQLPEYWSYDCPIDLLDGAFPPFGHIYGFSVQELDAHRAYIDKNLAKGFIRHSKSLAGSPILFVKKG